MIKKVFVFVLLFVLLFPVYVLADSATPIPDDGQYIVVDIQIDDYDIEINGRFDITINIINISNVNIENFFIENIFGGSNVNYIDDLRKFYNISLKSGEKISYAVSIQVPQDVVWFKNNDSYYTLLDLNIEYEIWETNKEGDSTFICGMCSNRTIVQKPLRIINLFDDEDIVKTEKDSQNECLYFINHGYLKDSSRFYSSFQNALSVVNIGTSTIENIHMNTRVFNDTYLKITDQSHSFFDNENPTTISPNEKSDLIITQYCDGYQNEIPDRIQVYYLLTYKLNEKYYALELQETYPTKLIKFPKLDIDIQTIKSESSSSEEFIIVNSSDNDYYNLYIDIESNVYDIYSNNNIILNQDFLIPILNRGDKQELSHIDMPLSNHGFIVGYIYDDMYFGWVSYLDKSDDNKYEFDYIEHILSGNYVFLTQITPKPTSIPIPTPTPFPSPNKDSNTTPTPTTSSMKASRENSAPIIITNIQTRSSIPCWVWIVLSIAIIGAGILIVMFRRKGKVKEKSG
ncbi:MAG: hypothetical protein KAQ68_02545 [Clostridiales bacterium]|nr:hypothetical protein [Clostridiales bacterium]